ncbi:MBL fold metallo-hydrolase [Seohaeicola saemankumensis]|uniref:MBL fold metallo-hydrolase n=1 Tax=Seohaeicola saemankumensis TaxID=481181 RepID=A0ABW3TBA0_9RHOB
MTLAPMIRRLGPVLAVAWLVLAPVQALADVLTVQPVTQDIWAIVGPKEQRNAENLANNATFGLIVTPEGAVLVDPGGSWKGAAMIHTAIRTITDQPVRHVINTGGQDHRWLGNGYWQAQGAQVIASAAAVADQTARASMQMSGLAQFLGTGLDGTEPAFADVTFETDHVLDLGGLRIEIMHRGQAHTPGDSYVWVPARQTVLTGDIVYTERLLGNGPQSNVRSWMTVFEAMASLAPAHLVPGHGAATDLAKARRDTYDYLVNLRQRIGALIEDGGNIIDAPAIDQSAFAYLEQFDALAGRNAQAAYEQMEWE